MDNDYQICAKCNRESLFVYHYPCCPDKQVCIHCMFAEVESVVMQIRYLPNIGRFFWFNKTPLCLHCPFCDSDIDPVDHFGDDTNDTDWLGMNESSFLFDRDFYNNSGVGLYLSNESALFERARSVLQNPQLGTICEYCGKVYNFKDRYKHAARCRVWCNGCNKFKRGSDVRHLVRERKKYIQEITSLCAN